MEIIHDSRQDGFETINSERERRTFRKTVISYLFIVNEQRQN